MDIKSFYYGTMDRVYGWAFKKIKLASVMSLISAIVQLAVLAIVWLAAGWKPALITYGVMSAIGIACWLIQIPYYRKTSRDIDLVARYWNNMVDKNPFLSGTDD